MSTNRPPFFVVAAGVAAPGPVTVAGTKIGDIVTSFNLTDTLTTVAETFERVVSVDGQVQQGSATDYHLKSFLFLIIPQGWKSLQ